MLDDRIVQTSVDALQAFVSSLPSDPPGSVLRVGLATAVLENH